MRSLFDIAVVVAERPMMQRPRPWRQLRPTWLVKASSDLELSATFRDNFFQVTTDTIKMSRASQITLATTCAVAIGTVAFVHFAQKQDKAVSEVLRHMIQDLTFVCRPCTLVSFEITNSSESSANDRPTSRCRRHSKRST